MARRANYFLIGLTVLACLFAAGPVIWGLLTSFKTPTQVVAYPPDLWPTPPTLQNFGGVWRESNFPVYFRNSVVVTIASVILSLILAVHAAYGLARFRFRGKTILMLGIPMTSMIPASRSRCRCTTCRQVNLYNTRREWSSSTRRGTSRS